jgi:hypothetical protein
VLRLNLHSEAGAPYVAAPVPRLPGSSGGVSSTPSGQLYGRYSVRFRATASGPGYKTAWLLWPDSRNWPTDGEIDYPEGSLDGGFAGFVHHQAGTSGADQKRIPSTGSAASYGAWHVATIEWSPGRVEFFRDDRSLGSETARVPNTPMHWVLQSETEVTATPTPDTSTANVEIDWVSVWKPSGSAAGSGSGAGPAPVPSPAPAPAPPGDTVTLAAVGDTCSGTACSQASATAQTVRNIAPFRFLHVGDFQYQNAGAGGATFTAGYETAFAGLHAITLPAFGATHDTEDGSGAWEGYPVSFFDANGAPEAQGKLSDHQWGYSYDLGAWHVVAINYKSGDVASVEADLAAHPSACLMAVSHAPAFGSPSAEHPTNEAVAYRDVLFRHGVDLIVSGHQHFYERLGPVDSAGAPDPNGATQLIVGLGGIGHYGRTSTAPESRVYNATAFGPTKLTLTPDGWSSEFVPDAGSPAFADTASGTCAD